MDDYKKAEVAEFLKQVPPVEFCCVYGSSLHPNNKDKSSMVDYIFGVTDSLQWHAENLNMNPDHYATWLARLGGAKLITGIADHIGIGVHFNPFVKYSDKMLKYGVVRMDDLVQDIQQWDRFYLSGRLQKPVHVLVDNTDVHNLNSSNLRAAVSAALLLLPSEFTQEELFAKICSLSYMGDLRMLFAEDKNKVTKIVQGQFDLFQSMYKPFLQEYEAKKFLSSSSSETHQLHQDSSISVSHSLILSLPHAIRSRMNNNCSYLMRTERKEKKILESGRQTNPLTLFSREEAVKSMKSVLRQTVMVSSARQAVSGLLTAGGINAGKYVAKKIQKAWKSRM